MAQRKILGFTGDRDALNYGGGIVLDQGYGPEWWFWDEPEGEKGAYYIHRINVADDVFADQSWADPFKVAKEYDVNPLHLQALGTSPRVMERVRALEMIAGAEGPSNLDSDPLRLSHIEMQRKFGPTFRAKSSARMNPARRRASYRSARANPTADRIKLYREWTAADDEFSNALQKAYGHRAGDMRYAYSWPGHPEVAVAAKRSLEAGAKWRRAIGREPVRGAK